MRRVLPLLLVLAALAPTVRAGEWAPRPAGERDLRLDVQVAIVRQTLLHEIDRLASALEPCHVMELAAAADRAGSREEVARLAAELADLALEREAALPGHVERPWEATGRRGDGPISPEGVRESLGDRLHRGVWMPSTEGHH